MTARLASKLGPAYGQTLQLGLFMLPPHPDGASSANHRRPRSCAQRRRGRPPDNERDLGAFLAPKSLGLMTGLESICNPNDALKSSIELEFTLDASSVCIQNRQHGALANKVHATDTVLA